MKAINLLLKILLVIILLVFVFLKILDPYTLVIKLNWNIELPKGYRKVLTNFINKYKRKNI